MDPGDLRKLLEGVREGTVSPDDAAKQLATLPYEDLGFAKVDHHRALRQGTSEVIFAQGKKAKDIIAIIQEMRASGSRVLITRISAPQAGAIKKKFPKAVYNPTGRTMRVPDRGPSPKADPGGLSGKGPVVTLKREGDRIQQSLTFSGRYRKPVIYWPPGRDVEVP